MGEEIAKNEDVAALEDQLAAQQEAAAAAAAAQQKQIDKLADQIAKGGAAASGDETDRRLAPGNNLASNEERAVFAVAAKKILTVTDLVLQNPGGEFGQLTIRRDPDPLTTGDEQVLLVSRLENFRDLDYHFVTPIIFKAGQELQVIVTCQTNDKPPQPENACGQVAVLYTGSLAKA